MTKKTLRVMMIGDVSGQSGMGALFLGLSSAKRQYNADFVILNGENAAGGFGITIEDYNNMKKNWCGCHYQWQSNMAERRDISVS